MAKIPFPSREQISLDSLQNQFNGFVERLWHGGISTPPFDGQDWAPCLELRDEERQFVVTVELPGVKRESIEIGAKPTTLVIRGEKQDPSETDDTLSKTLRSERRYGSFRRYLDLPEEVDVDRVSARMVQGVLHVSLPKVPAPQSTEHKVSIQEDGEDETEVSLTPPPPTPPAPPMGM